MIIQITYLLASFIAVAAMVPQIKQLLVTKESDELNLGTWVAWAACQGVATVYAVSVGAIAYIFVSFVWVAFYVAMVALIIKYRHTARKERKAQLATTEVSVSKT